MQRFFISLGLFTLGALAFAQAPKTLGTFTLHEDFGVAHPEQIVMLEPGIKLPAAVALLDEQGKPAPFQVMGDGRIALRTDLPAGATKSWKLVAAKASAVAPGVAVVERPDGYEIVNDRVGIRIPKASADPAKTPSPIQGLRFQDGTWTAVGPNYMPRPAKAMRVEFLDRGPLVVRVRVAYLYDRALLRSHRPELPEIPAGEAPYATTIEMQAGQPVILFEEACEVDISYGVDITDGLTPDRAQYRGHHANSTEAGMGPDGGVYSYTGNRRHDALVHLKFDGAAKDRWSRTTYPYLSHWDPWGVNTGFYWQLYDSRPNGSDNLFGIFAGRASRLIKPGLSGVSFDTGMVDGKPRIGLQVRFQRLMPTQFYSTHMRFGWGIYLGKKRADVKPQLEVQQMNRVMNLHSGVNLTALAPLPADYPDPKEGYGNLYAPANAWQGLADALREERKQGGKTRYQQQYNLNPYFHPILDYWADPSPATAKKAADVVTGFATAYLDTQVNGEGIYQHTTHYFMGASNMSSYVSWADLLLASAHLPADERAKLKRAMALFASCLWNHDVAPMHADCGMNWGPQNMSAMWLGTRYTFTLFLSDHPIFSRKVEEVRKEALKLLYSFTNDAGACSACAHYAGASMVPILNLLQQMQRRGVMDAFATEPRLARYAEWEMQLLTPPEPRFGGLRKIVAVGDGSTEQSTRIGQIGTGFARSNPALSARLMGAWQAMGQPHDNFYGASALKIDPTLPAVSPKLGSAQFDGWMSVLRHGWETPNETAIHFINGDYLTDHRHGDMGSLVIYALGAPLSLDWGPIYYPRVAGSYMHSMALPESVLGFPWAGDRPPLDKPAEGWSVWHGQTRHTPLLDFTESSSASADFGRGKDRAMSWRRTVRNLHPDPAHPVIVIEDTFGGNDLAGKPVISTLNMMAEGEVDTPAGVQAPELRMHTPDQNTAPEKLPSAGPVFPLPAGLNKFAFTGQWGIDWELYTDAEVAMQASLGNWGNSWHPSTEQSQFRKANNNKPYEERQHILRLRGQDAMRVIILPYRKGDRPNPFTVEKRDGQLLIRGNMTALALTEQGYSAEIFTAAGRRQSLTAFGAEPVEDFGLRIAGGPAELVITETGGTLTVGGPAGERTITVPREMQPAAHAAVRKAGENWIVTYAGGARLALKVDFVK